MGVSNATGLKKKVWPAEKAGPNSNNNNNYYSNKIAFKKRVSLASINIICLMSVLSRIFEVGCGVGNTILPILDTNKNPGLYVYGSDFSSKAVDVLRSHEKFDSARLVY